MVGPRIVSDVEDRAEVELLQARLEKTVQLTKKIKTSQARLETSGSSVQEAIGPIFDNTQRLQVLGKSLHDLNLPLPSAAGLSQYLASLRRVGRALVPLASSNLRSNQEAIAALQSLGNYGRQQVEEVFRVILSEISTQVEPLHYITKNLQFPLAPPEKSSVLNQINGAATASLGPASREGYVPPAARIYAEVRGRYLSCSLQNLAAASLNTAKKRAPDAVYRRGSNGIGTYTLALEGLFMSEVDNVRAIFAAEEWSGVCRATFRTPLADYTKTVSELNSHIQKNLTTDCFLAYEIIDIVMTLSARLEPKTVEPKEPLLHALRPVRETAKLSLRELLDDTRRRIMHIQVLPSDGSVTPITAETMARLQNLPDFSRPLATVLVSLGDGNWTTRASSDQASGTLSRKGSYDVGADPQQLLAHYCLDTIDTLMQNLEARARALLKHRSAMGAFVANNVAVIERAVRASDLGPLLAESASRFDGWRKKGVSMYLDGWKEPSAFLLDVQYTNRGGQRPPSGGSSSVNSIEVIKSLGNKEKDAIKDKFRGFNTSFDEMVGRHRNLALEREVRSLLAREVQAVIEPLYGRFWDRYHEIDKGKGKYVKFDKGQLAAALASLG
ncbi:MAG: exocyst complex component exo70 [Lichina confinis]|nr:MAG: exocyst complex component exo70 [Lichina confinis]